MNLLIVVGDKYSHLPFLHEKLRGGIWTQAVCRDEQMGKGHSQPLCRFVVPAWQTGLWGFLAPHSDGLLRQAITEEMHVTQTRGQRWLPREDNSWDVNDVHIWVGEAYSRQKGVKDPRHTAIKDLIELGIIYTCFTRTRGDTKVSDRRWCLRSGQQRCHRIILSMKWRHQIRGDGSVGAQIIRWTN